MRQLTLAIVLGIGCGGGAPPDLLGLSDQVAVVGQRFVLELNGVDPDGDRLSYGVAADFALMGAAITQLPSGVGVFQWTPLASDVGSHGFDFTVSDGSNSATVTITIDVRATAGGIPVFREPLGAGRVVDVVATPCTTVDILVEDQDTAQVTIEEIDPKIEGAMFEQTSGTMAMWRWCPTPAQIAATDRYTLNLAADDSENPRALKNYVIVLAGSGGTPQLVINEVDYDNIGNDTAEYIEIANFGTTAASLAGLSVTLVNGATNAPYDTVDLSSIGSLDAGQFLVIAGAGVTVPASAVKLDPLWVADRVQNGAPDGIAIVDPVQQIVIDALSYEGSISAAALPDFPAAVSLVEGTALDVGSADSNTVNVTLCRDPVTPDTNNAAVDWKVCPSPTVGLANAP